MRVVMTAMLCLLLSGCISTNITRLDDEVRLSKAAESVEVLYQRPDQPYQVIAVIEAKGKTVFDGFDDLQNKMLEKAALMGGDALLLCRKCENSEYILTGMAMIQSDTKNMAGAVIVYDKTG